jgi:hypothetical protein
MWLMSPVSAADRPNSLERRQVDNTLQMPASRGNYVLGLRRLGA